jgi:hypothetical protein
LDVKNDSTQPLSREDADKATLFIVGDDVGVAHPTIRIGVDGAWVGATRSSSYFSIPLEPGEHHLCASGALSNPKVSPETALVHFAAEAGKTYYFRTRVTAIQYQAFLDFAAVDSDQGKLLVALAHRQDK